MRARPTRIALTATVLVALAGCAGTDAPESQEAPATTAEATTSSSAAPSSASEPAGQRIEVEVAGGQVSGDVGRVPVPAGEAVSLVITSDTADEVHVHGYDLTAALTPGTPAELAFDATIPGVFEVELHDAGTVLLTLQVG